MCPSQLLRRAAASRGVRMKAALRPPPPLVRAVRASGPPRPSRWATPSGRPELVNTDCWFDDPLASASVDGRSVVVRAVPRGGRLDDAQLVARLTADQIEFDERRLR